MCCDFGYFVLFYILHYAQIINQQKCATCQQCQNFTVRLSNVCTDSRKISTAVTKKHRRLNIFMKDKTSQLRGILAQDNNFQSVLEASRMRKVPTYTITSDHCRLRGKSESKFPPSLYAFVHKRNASPNNAPARNPPCCVSFPFT